MFSGMENNQDSRLMQDPHDELKLQNVLIVDHTIYETAEYFGLEIGDVESQLSKGRDLLYNIRLNRPRAHLDNKILSSWNGESDHDIDDLHIFDPYKILIKLYFR